MQAYFRINISIGIGIGISIGISIVSVSVSVSAWVWAWAWAWTLVIVLVQQCRAAFFTMVVLAYDMTSHNKIGVHTSLYRPVIWQAFR